MVFSGAHNMLWSLFTIFKICSVCGRDLIIDAQSVKNGDTAGRQGYDYDAGKQVSGIKRPVAVDAQGLSDAVAVSTANAADRTGAWPALQCCRSA